MQEPARTRYGSFIFDFDNTLVDSSQGYRHAFEVAFEEFGMPYDPKKYDEYIRTPIDELYLKYNPGCPCKFRDFLSMVITIYDNEYLDTSILFPDAERCIRSLFADGKNLAIASNSLKEHLMGVLERQDVADLFTAVIGMDDVMNRKPDPEPVILCMKRMGSMPGDTLMIGDSKNDIISGARAGTDTVLVERGQRFVYGCTPTFTVKMLDELI